MVGIELEDERGLTKSFLSTARSNENSRDINWEGVDNISTGDAVQARGGDTLLSDEDYIMEC